MGFGGNKQQRFYSQELAQYVSVAPPSRDATLEVVKLRGLQLLLPLNRDDVRITETA